MILKTEDLKNACAKILTAIDTNTVSPINGDLELRTTDGIFYLNVTNREYFVRVKLGPCDADFHATVNANSFLKLIAQFTTEAIEFNCTENTLIVKGNGVYKFPLIYDNDHILNLPEITITNPTVDFNIDSGILNSILVNNSKELSKIPKTAKVALNPIQKMYYVDEQGAITFYNGACVNKFTLEKPVKMLLNGNLVKLFSLFKNETVKFTLGYDALSETLIQTKVRFESDGVCITAILNCDDTLIKSMPAQTIRDRAFNEYPFVITLNRGNLLQTIQRLLLFTNNNATNNYKAGSKFKFNKSSCTISDYSEENSEEIKYSNELASDMTYEASLDLIDLKLALESNTDQYITLSFGDHKAFVVAKDNVYTVIPELVNR